MQLRDVHLGSFRWLDLQGPTKSKLKELGSQLLIPEAVLMHCLDPEYLPKFQVLSDQTIFLIFRVMDPKPKASADSITELTTKVVVFIGKDYVLTVHRQSLSFLDALIETYSAKSATEVCRKSEMMRDLIFQMVTTFEAPLLELERRLDVIEEKLYSGKAQKRFLKEAYILKRHSGIFKKILKFTQENVTKLATREDFSTLIFEDAKDLLDRFIFNTDDIFDNINGMLGLYLSLASQKTNEASYKTNEVMRVLTVLTVFFLPLNFIAGVYGMNFKFMPELEHPHGYYMVLGLMCLIVLILFIWIWKKGWLKPADDMTP